MKPPFRADQVGSLLRPPALRDAREKFKRGELSATALEAVEDKAILAAVDKQESLGLESITDGEFRRDWWHLDFLAQLDGVELKDNAGPLFKFSGQGEQPPIDVVQAAPQIQQRGVITRHANTLIRLRQPVFVAIPCARGKCTAAEEALPFAP